MTDYETLIKQALDRFKTVHTKLKESEKMTEKLNWEKLSHDGRDYKANTPEGLYIISVDSFQAGGAAYLWVPGQPDDDDYYMHFNTRFEAMAAAERHYAEIEQE